MIFFCRIYHQKNLTGRHGVPSIRYEGKVMDFLLYCCLKFSMKMLMADFHETEKVVERRNICVCFFLDQCKDFTSFPIRSVFNNLQLIIFSIYIYIVTFCYPPLSWYMLFVQWPKKKCFLISANLHCRNLVYCKFMVSWIQKKNCYISILFCIEIYLNIQVHLKINICYITSRRYRR